MRRWLASLACLLGMGTGIAFGQTNETALLRARVKELELTVAELEAKLRTLEARTSTGGCEGSHSPAPASAWQDPSCWEKLRKGMNRFDVFRLLGEPGKVSAYDGFERWEYPAALGARVNFDDRGVLVGWTPPPP